MSRPVRERDVVGQNAAEKNSARGTKIAPAAPSLQQSPLQNVLGNLVVQTLFNRGQIQAKLRVSQPGDPDEVEADRIADEVAYSRSGDLAVANSHPLSASTQTPHAVQRKCACSGGAKCPECEIEDVEGAKGIRRKSATGVGQRSSGSFAQKSVVQGLGSGRALDSPVRKSMESRFGHDFSSVRVHDDSKAASTADSINARAFTSGNDIAFAKGEYAPNTPSGLRLLVHELVHTIQQRGEKNRLDRTPAGQYETTGISLNTENVKTLTKGNFWVEKISRSFELREDPRLSKDPEERDAVLSTVLKVQPPSGFKSPVTELVTIPARKIAGSKALLYKIAFIPRAKMLPRVDVLFVAEDTSAITKATGSAPAGFAAQAMSLTTFGFPDNNPMKYWKEHPEEQNQVLAWVQNSAPSSFNQVISTAVTATLKKKPVTRKTIYQVSGSKDATGKVTSITVNFVGAPHESTQAPDADYHSKDALDERLEHAQASLDPKKKDKLGAIRGIAALPHDEQSPVKHAIFQYFESGTRNSEVDAVIPLPDSTRRVLYTLRFRPTTNDVDVERIGEEGKDARISPPRLSLARIARFTELSNDVPKLKEWVHKRYPAVTPTGSTAKEICANVDKEIRAGAGTAKWFQDNYGILILDAAAGTTRLQTAHPSSFSAVQTADMQNFSSDELIVLESTLETITDSIVAGFKGIQMARQKVRLELGGTKKRPKGVPKPKEAGLSLQNGTERSIVIFNQFSIDDKALFIGGHRPDGSTTVEPDSAGTLAHELGHTVSWGPGIKDAFDKMVKKEKIETFTWYAASDKKNEFFAESFMLFQLDPEWLLANSPKIFNFFDVLTKTGSPPAPKATP
jgi:Domain of unknown function (DUF4157)